jgi:hypothetical protein
VRALLDFHHADLLESLHLLLEDRLGIECWIPTGFDWWEQGYWAFGKTTWGDDRLARQFLQKANVEIEDSHPGRRKRCIELSESRDVEWDFVVASLPDNYAGYHAFASESDAKFVIQVGNVNQAAGWQFSPWLILNSSAASVPGRSVTYHQEFHVAAFEPHPERMNPRRITNFVNCVQALPCYPLLQEAQREFADFEWCIHGIDGADGNVKPTARVGELMGEAGWAWHDKVTGDGFGHVIFNWACVGRPLIGHASHYAGQLAEPFWEDGVTCIDLDRHSIGEAAQLVREISADSERHTAMCEALRSRFTESVDFGVEAERIATMLL